MTTMLAVVLFGLTACASRDGPPDPAQLQKEREALRVDEEALVRSTIDDPGRAGRVLDLLVERDRIVSQQHEVVRRYREDLRALNADYAAPRERFDALIDEYNASRKETQLELVKLIQDLKQRTTASEWKAIAKFELKRLDPRALIYGEGG